jgi:hypothetical protein
MPDSRGVPTPSRSPRPVASHPGSALAAVSRLSGDLDVLWVGADNALGSTYWDIAAGQGWPDHKPFGITPPGATA